MDQKPWRIMNEGLGNWSKVVRVRLTYCRKRKDEIVKTHKMWKVVGDSTVTFSGKISNYAIEIWANNLKVKIAARTT